MGPIIVESPYTVQIAEFQALASKERDERRLKKALVVKLLHQDY